MKDPIRYESIQDPLDDEERELMDPENWEWENPVEVVVADNPLVSFRIALTHDEHMRMARAARAQGLRTPEFIKHVAIVAAHAEVSQP